jgi:hypothetical protein
LADSDDEFAMATRMVVAIEEVGIKELSSLSGSDAMEGAQI